MLQDEERDARCLRRPVQARARDLAARRAHKGRLLRGRDLQGDGQEPGKLLGGTTLARFDLAQRGDRAAGALRQLCMGQIEALRAAFEPLTEERGRIGLVYANRLSGDSVLLGTKP